MDAHSLRVLEFDQVRVLLAEQATCALGRERAEELTPSTDEATVRRLQTETSEAVRLIDTVGQLPLGGIRDVRAPLRVAQIEGVLEPHALLLFADTLAAARRLRAFLSQHAERAPGLADYGRQIGEFPAIEAAIAAAVNDHGEIRDDASPTLARLRREAKTTHARLMERLQTMLRSAAYREMIQEPIVTMRDDRYCIPVKAEWRGQFGGLVHDQSSSGATVFMEPATAVELGNELRQIAIRERQEVERNLREITGRIGAAAEPLGDTVSVLAEIDFIGARAKLSLLQSAAEPAIAPGGPLELRQARHPILRGEVVPIDVALGEESRILVITGPNTGGKTVGLKTVGLLALMAHSGLHVPADSPSRLPLLAGVYADIGDEQSIQQSLSTFSGHITNIARIFGDVARTGARSLVLLDEIGAGTDPTEGAALAKAILTHLLGRGALCIATTHYGELKEFAYTHSGVENASVEFDLESLQPTYRLLTGLPGSSNAFTIATRLGLPGGVVQDARSLVGTEKGQLTHVIERLTADQRASEADRRRASRAAEEVESIRARYERELKQLRADSAETLRRARAEADQLLRKSRMEVATLQDELRRMEKEARQLGEQASGAAGLARLGEEMRRTARSTEARIAAPDPKGDQGRDGTGAEEPPVPDSVRIDPRPPERGDLVWIPALSQRGTLLEEPVDARAQVQVGSMRMTLPYASLQRIMGQAPALTPRPQPVATGGSPDLRLQARASISPELHLRGQHVEEAIRSLDDYMDDACLAGLSPLRIVHGKGTGVLRRAIWEWLQSHPQVTAVRLGEDGEGGSGVTVVELRE